MKWSPERTGQRGHFETVRRDSRDKTSPGPIKRIFFDFDLTIARVHAFKVLSGESPGLRPPYAMTERGQIARIKELNAEGQVWTYNEEYGGIVPTRYNGELWTHAALGGVARIEILRKLFSDLRAEGIVLTIVTKGYVGAARTILRLAGLIHNFDRVIGHIGSIYGVDHYDMLVDSLCSSQEGDESCELYTEKAEFIEIIMANEGLRRSEAILVEDDPDEIRSVLAPGICEAVFVRKQHGMMAEEIHQLLRFARLPV